MVRCCIHVFGAVMTEHQEASGVDPTRLPEPDIWRARYESEYGKEIESRKS